MRKLITLVSALIVIAAASSAQNTNLTLVSHLSYGSQTLSNICGWVDTADGKEYALVGAQNGLSVVDISVPANPVEIVQIPGPSSIWREIKTNGNYAYVTTEDGAIGLQIVDLTNLPATNLTTATWTPTIGGTQLSTIHALHIDNGKVYLYGSNIGNQGAIIADITTNPMAPVYLGSWDNRYVHDGYVRGDTLYACHVYDGDCEIVNLTNPAAGVSVGDFQTPNFFTHNSWLSADSKLCFTTDEVNDSYLAAFDISNLNNITELDRIQSNPGSNSVVHNTHIIQKNSVDYAVTSWYNDGFTIVDCTRPHNLVQVGNYDTDPAVSGPGMDHCWGVYPFFPSGTIVASDIQNGLFVLSPTYVRACYLEGVVTSCTSNTPLSGVNVAIQLVNPQSDAHLDITDFQGQYAVGVAVPDTYLVVFSKTGYVTDTDTVVLAAGVVTLDSVKLCGSPVFPYSGRVFDNSTSAGISGASVSIYDSNSRWDTITDVSGNFTVSTIFAGTYTISAGKWGSITKCLSNQNVTSAFPPINIGLDKGFYDDFSFDFGWTVTGNASGGIWEIGEPQGTYDGYGGLVNPEYDVAGDCGVEAYVTGNTGTQVSDDDVDGGSTILTSPVFDLSGYINPYVCYSRWKNISYNSTDTIIISINNGTTTATLENVKANNTGQASWVNRKFKVASYIPLSSAMTFRIKASDLGTDNTIEGALDRFYIVDSTNSSVDELSYKIDAVIYPNPSLKSEEIVLAVKGFDFGIEKPEFKIVDLLGREVHVQKITSESTPLNLHLRSGIFFYQIISKGRIIANGKICLE